MNTIEFLTKQFLWQSKFLCKKIENVKSQRLFMNECDFILNQLMLSGMKFEQTKPKEETIITHLRNNTLSMPKPKNSTLWDGILKKALYQAKARSLFLDVLESYDKRFMRGMQ